MKYLEGLNDAQKEAVLETDGPLLIIAGAGAGKTKTLTHRVLHLIKQGVSPNEILAITFTNKAAKEMRERIMSLIESDAGLNLPLRTNEKPFVSTFHSLGVHILRDQAHRIGLVRHFSIYDRSDSKSAIKKGMKILGYDVKEHDPNRILGIISREKGNMVTQSEYDAKETNNDFQKTMVSGVWREYEKILKEEKALDFDDLLLKTALILQKDSEVRDFYQNKWKYILVDEYQDTNEVQYNTTKILAAKSRNLCVVGDIDQNIYSWRGATIKNILHFEKDYPEAKVVTLEQNYRSTKTILQVANEIIEINKNRREKKLFTENSDGEKVTLYNAYNENDEARYISEKCDEIVGKGVNPNEIAVLYRANFQSRVLEEAFLNMAVPYQVLGVRFFDRKEIKDILSFIKVAINPDDLNSMGRIINIPPRGIGKVTFLKIAEGHENELKGAVAIKVQNFRNMIREVKEKVNNDTPSNVIKFILKRSGLEEHLKETGEEGVEKLENIKELASLASKYDPMLRPDGIEKLLEDAALATDQDELEKDNGGVKLMTVHASKGLEFDYVFISGLEEGLFPHERMNEKKDDDEEERRLFYVALTRARKKIYLTYAGIRTIFGSQQVNIPSKFLGDINDKHLQNEESEQTTFSAKDIFIDF